MSGSGSQKRRRYRRIVVPLTPDELDAVRRLADNKGHSAAALARNALLGLPLPRRRRTAMVNLAAFADLRNELAFLRGELGKIGSNVNQIAHQLNAKDGVLPAYLQTVMAELDETLSMFPELRDAYMRVMGGERSEDDN